MILFWKMKKTMATGKVMMTAAASFSGYWFPWLSCPLASAATPLVRVVKAGDWVEMMKCDSSFHDPWKERMAMVTMAGRAIGRTTDQKIRKVPARSIFACSSTLRGTDSKKLRMMKTPDASTKRGRIIPA